MKVIYSDIKSEYFKNHFTSCPLILLKLSKFPGFSKFEGLKSLATRNQILHKGEGELPAFKNHKKALGPVGTWKEIYMFLMVEKIHQ